MTDLICLEIDSLQILIVVDMSVNIFQRQKTTSYPSMLKDTVLFTIDLRIDKRPLKLKVNSNDGQSDLIAKLDKLITWRRIPQNKMKNRLEEQFKRIVSDGTVSTNVRNKLNELLDQSKFLIVGIETENKLDDETPFKILQESTLNGRKWAEKKKNFHYLDQSEGVSLRVKYQSKENSRQNVEKEGSRPYFSKQMNKSNKYSSPQKYSYLIQQKLRIQPQNTQKQVIFYENGEENDNFEVIQKKYEAIDRKCQDYIVRNLSNSQEMRASYDRYQQSKQRDGESNCWSKQKNSHRIGLNQYQGQGQGSLIRGQSGIRVGRFNDETEIRAQNQTKRYNLGQNVFNRKHLYEYKQEQIDNTGESFNQYKVNRHKSTHNISKLAVWRDDNESKKVATGREHIVSSKSSARLDRKQLYQNLIREYPESSSCNVRRDPTTKKFSYLHQDI